MDRHLGEREREERDDDQNRRRGGEMTCRSIKLTCDCSVDYRSVLEFNSDRLIVEFHQESAIGREDEEKGRQRRKRLKEACQIQRFSDRAIRLDESMRGHNPRKASWSKRERRKNAFDRLSIKKMSVPSSNCPLASTFRSVEDQTFFTQRRNSLSL